jgi:hypothetical protein
MTEEKETPQETSKGLPFVTEQSIRAIESQFTTGGEGKRWGDHLETVKKRMVEENPNLVEFINKQVSKYPLEFHLPMFEIAVGTIAVLEHQVSSNKMNSLTKLSKA